MASSIFGSDSSSALPGGNVAKPLIIALLALFASRYLARKAQTRPRLPSLSRRSASRRRIRPTPRPATSSMGLAVS